MARTDGHLPSGVRDDGAVGCQVDVHPPAVLGADVLGEDALGDLVLDFEGRRQDHPLVDRLQNTLRARTYFESHVHG